jgi:hypothetical protein
VGRWDEVGRGRLVQCDGDHSTAERQRESREVEEDDDLTTGVVGGVVESLSAPERADMIDWFNGEEEAS